MSFNLKLRITVTIVYGVVSAFLRLLALLLFALSLFGAITPTTQQLLIFLIMYVIGEHEVKRGNAIMKELKKEVK